MYKLPMIAPERLEFAAEIFLAEARKTELRLNPMALPKVKKLSDYSDSHRALLMSSIKKAILSATPEYEQAFKTWRQRKTDTVD